jgi:murein DD-endopeptidase MepM/ murein hydrolase activator NlpD
MKVFITVLIAVTAVLGTGIFLLTREPSGEAAPSSVSVPSSEQIVRQEALAPTLTLGGKLLSPGFTARGEAAAPGELSDAAGSALVKRGEALPELVFSQAPDQTTVSLLPKEGGEPLFLGTLDQLGEFTPEKSGEYLLDLWASWDGRDGGFAGLTGYRLALTYDLGIRLAVDRQEVPQGYCVVLRAENLPEGTETVTAVTDMGFTPTFYPYEGEQIALLPAKYSNQTGEYHITLTAGAESQDFTLSVTDGGFDVTVQQFNVDQSVADSTVNNQEANIIYEQVTRPLKNLGDPEKYWEGPFQLPIDRQYVASSSTFGRIRIINGSQSQHAGIDYPAPTGTQVYAPNNGRVLFAGYLQLTGNMICIEHGFGLKSWYYHLDAVDVEAGQMVKTGDPIGKVGATGFVTGPHLHFTMSVNNIYTNPEQYLAADPLAQ